MIKLEALVYVRNLLIGKSDKKITQHPLLIVHQLGNYSKGPVTCHPRYLG